eukprot:1143883-Pelagomonas_calceolata.AAC.5
MHLGVQTYNNTGCMRSRAGKASILPQAACWAELTKPAQPDEPASEAPGMPAHVCRPSAAAASMA